MRTCQSEARRLEQACERGELIPDMLSHALTWWLYTHGKLEAPAPTTATRDGATHRTHPLALGAMIPWRTIPR